MLNNMINRELRVTNQNFFLFGPRGTGKSTWLKKHFPNGYFIDLLNPGIQLEYLSHPETLIHTVHPLPDNTDIIVDEVQKAPELLSCVHSLIEEKRGWRFILTGSSARKLKRAGVDLLAGRALVKTMHPFTAVELGEEFNLENALTFGLVPSVIMSQNPSESLKSYVAVYLQEEVLTEGLIRNLSTFSRFLEVLSFSHGSQINAASIGRECAADRKSVDSWVQIIVDLLLGHIIKPFRKRASRATVSHPKFYFFDCGVFKSLRPKGPLDKPAEIDGGALEGLVMQHLLAWIAYGNRDIEIYFWRSRRGVEVDFILYGENCFTAIEVKNSGKVRPEDLKSLKTFKEDYPECMQQILIYRGDKKLLIDNILCIPCEEFLKALLPDTDIRDV